MHISFEYFPPKTRAGLTTLLQTTQQLKSFEPEFFSVTYGAAGSTQDHTLNTVLTLQHECKIHAAPHISCVEASQKKIRCLLHSYQQQGIHRLIVLRGDTPSGVLRGSNDFNYAYQLIEFIRKETGAYFFIETAVYPEMHPETLDPQKHMEHFKMKVSAGANRAITQYFYNPDAYFQLLDDCAKYQITIPIIPGIMPITNYTQLARFSQICGAEIPRWLAVRLEKIKENPEAILKFGTEVVSRLCERLIEGGAPGLHFYTLNKAAPSVEILKNLHYSFDLVQ